MFRIPSEKQRLRQKLTLAERTIDAYEAQMERDRQWRLNSLPELLAAEVRAKRAEARVAELEAGIVRTIPSPGRAS